MKALKITGIVVAILVVILGGTVVLLPSHAHMERSIVINAKPEQVFAEINNFQSFNSWSPWAKLDPDTKYDFSGAASGVGAVMNWSSENDNVGIGSQTIVESEENKRIRNEMTFSGMDGKSYAEFVLTPEGDATKVTWTYDGDMSGFAKIFGAMMDRLLGPSYEQGLSSLKQVVESRPSPAKEPADQTTAK